MTTNVTFDNYEDFPVGTKVVFNFGAYFPLCDGKITGWNVEPATKFFPARIWLEAEYFDPSEERVVKTTVTQFTTRGIGVYINEVFHEK